LTRLRIAEPYLRAVRTANARMAATCYRCRYYGSCSGYYMAEATPEQRHLGAEGQLECGVVLPIQQYIEERLVAFGLVDKARDILRSDLIEAKLRQILSTNTDS
jgi:uncharacterized protein